jgi:hypothetical protein
MENTVPINDKVLGKQMGFIKACEVIRFDYRLSLAKIPCAGAVYSLVVLERHLR